MKTLFTNHFWILYHRDIKTYGHYAFIVSEATSHGMQVFDLNQLLTTSVATTFSADARYSSGVGKLHNIFINEDSATAYLLGGSNNCSGGLHMVDISNPLIPIQSGCFPDDGYTHDVQCVIYNGPDTQYVGKEICFAFNEDIQSPLWVQCLKHMCTLTCWIILRLI